MDFTDLDKACPKDSFLLPQINQLVDSIVESLLYNFYDAFSGYNQIKIHLDDQKKISFNTDKGLYF